MIRIKQLKMGIEYCQFLSKCSDVNDMLIAFFDDILFRFWIILDFIFIEFIA